MTFDAASLPDRIYRSLELAAEPARPHLGASQIGGDCERALWYGFRWVTPPAFPGRVLRLFSRGHDEEHRFNADLKRVGFEVHAVDPKTGRQYTYNEHGGHFGGSLDGLALIEGVPHLLEYKTSGLKPFNDLVAKGVRESKPVHFSQMQVYMHWVGFSRALYMVVCKDDDRLHCEVVEYDEAIALALIAKAKRIIDADTPPARINNNPGFYTCKWCDHYDACHQQKAAAFNCRTCISSTPVDGGWHCNVKDKLLSVAEQRAGCADHRFIPPLLPFADVVGGDMQTRRVDYKVIATDVAFSNGAKGPGSYLSSELAAMAPSAIGDPGVEALRDRFDGTVTSSSLMKLAPDEIPF